MTGPERQTLELLSAFVRDWRNEDSEWKARTDERLRKVEIYVAADESAELTEEKIVTAAGISRRARNTLVVAAVGVGVTAVLGVVNLLT